jgi:hypothetical protein
LATCPRCCSTDNTPFDSRWEEIFGERRRIDKRRCGKCHVEFGVISSEAELAEEAVTAERRRTGGDSEAARMVRIAKEKALNGASRSERAAILNDRGGDAPRSSSGLGESNR